MTALEHLEDHVKNTFPQATLDEIKPGTKPGYLICSVHPKILYVGGEREGYDGEYGFWEACKAELENIEDNNKPQLSDSETRIYKMLCYQPKTVRDISRETGYTVNTVRISIKNLIESGHVAKGDKIENHSGRGHPSYLFLAVGVKYPNYKRR